MSSFITTIFLFFITAGLASASETASKRILLYGDSIVAGYGLTEKESLDRQLEKYLRDNKQNVKIINGGVSGDTTAAGLNRLEWTLKKHTPDLVFLALGGNDVLRGIATTHTRSNLKAMLDILKTHKIPVILSAVEAPVNLGTDYSESLRSVYTSLAETYDIPLYPFLLTDVFNQKGLMLADGVHPSAQGIQVIAQPLGDFLIDYLKENNTSLNTLKNSNNTSTNDIVKTPASDDQKDLNNLVSN